MFCTISRPFTLQCRLDLVVLQVCTRWDHRPVRSGHGPDGAWATTTLNVQSVALLEVSTAVHVTVLVPRSNAEPEAGEQFAEAIPQLSLAVGFAKVTTAL